MSAALETSITIFYCINSYCESAAVENAVQADVTCTYIKMACSSMVVSSSLDSSSDTSS